MFGMVPYRKKGNSLVKNFFSDDFLDDFFNNDFFNNDFFMRQSAGFRADIKENDKEYIIEAELPGVDKDAIDIELKDNYLTITANQKDEINEERENYIRRERRLGKISRSFLVDDVKRDKIKAEYKDGILNIVMPKTEEGKKSNYKIDIQ